MFIKKLTRQGNSSALIIDRQIMDLLDIDQDTQLRVTINGRQLIVEPIGEEELAERFKKAMNRTGKKNAKGFASLAK